MHNCILVFQKSLWVYRLKKLALCWELYTFCRKSQNPVSEVSNPRRTGKHTEVRRSAQGQEASDRQSQDQKSCRPDSKHAAAPSAVPAACLGGKRFLHSLSPDNFTRERNNVAVKMPLRNLEVNEEMRPPSQEHACAAECHYLLHHSEQSPLVTLPPVLRENSKCLTCHNCRVGQEPF